MLIWKDWSPESLDEAFREAKALFVRLDSEACRYSRMMDVETFSQKEVCRVLQDSFVPVRVAMEERPDLSILYGELAQWAIGEAGSPIHLFLTPDLEAFFVGGYFPVEARYGLPGFYDLLKRLESLWREKDPQLFSQAREATNHLSQWRLGPNENSPRLSAMELVELAERNLMALWDQEKGGFGKAPRFFYFDAIRFLWKRAKTPDSLERIVKHLLFLTQGGVFEARSGHLFRHSLDEAYRSPKPEISLEETILFIELLSEILETQKDSRLEWILRRQIGALKDFKGDSGFYASRLKELPKLEAFLISKEEGSRLKETYPALHWDFSSEGLTEDFALFRLASWPETNEEIKEWTKACEENPIELAFEAGASFRLDWNAQLAVALAKAARVLRDGPLQQEASRLAEALCEALERGELHHSLRAHPAGGASSEDKIGLGYVNLSDRAALGRLCLHWGRLESDAKWKSRADRLVSDVVKEHWHSEQRVFFFNSKNQSDILMNFVDCQDRSLPSATGLAFEFLSHFQRDFPSKDLENLLPLSEEKLRAQAEKQIGAFTRFALVMADRTD